MKKQTAVEWLITEVKKFNTIITREYMLMLLEQAKQMEKQQIIDAFWNVETNNAEEYYNQTFEK